MAAGLAVLAGVSGSAGARARWERPRVRQSNWVAWPEIRTVAHPVVVCQCFSISQESR